VALTFENFCHAAQAAAKAAKDKAKDVVNF